MRIIGTFSDKGEAERFRWLLAGYGIACNPTYDESEVGDIWIVSEDDLHLAKNLMQKFKENPQAREFLTRIEEGKKVAQRSLSAEKRSKRQIVGPRSSWLGSYPVTISLITLSSLIFLLGFSGGLRSQGNSALILRKFLRFSIYPGHDFHEILAGEVWRLITPILLHGDIFHIFFNMTWLWILGRQVEGLESSRRLLLLVICIAIPSHLVFYLVAGPAFEGMSGVTYGLLAYIWFMGQYGGKHSYRSDDSMGRFFLIWYILCLILTVFGVFRAANTIHGVGALAGFTVAFFASGKYRQAFKHRRFNRIFTKQVAIGLGLLIAGMAVDFLSY